MPNNKKRKLFRTILGSIGIVLLFELVRRIGVGDIIENISRVGIYFIVICLLGFGWLFCQASAWWIIQRAFQPVSLLVLFRTKLIAEGLNTLLPAANIGGEAARPVMLKESVPLKESIPGVLFDKTIEYIASLFYMVTGLTLCVFFLGFPRSLRLPTAVVLLSIAVCIILLVGLQFRGFFRILKKFAGAIPGGRQWFSRQASNLEELDENIHFLYGYSRLRIFFAWILHVIARILGALEIYLILRALDISANVFQVLFISIVVIVMNTAFFIMPGQWGVSEGAHLLVMKIIGYPATIGLSLGVIRRLRKLFFAGLAVVLIVLKKDRLAELKT